MCVTRDPYDIYATDVLAKHRIGNPLNWDKYWT